MLQKIIIKLKLIRFEVMFIVQACQNNRLINLLAFALLFSSPKYYVICWIVEVSSVWIAEEFKKFVRSQLLFNSPKQMHHTAQDSKLYCNLVGL